MKQNVRVLQVGEDSQDQRLDNFLLRELKGVPKSHIYRIIRSAEVRVNKSRVQASKRLSTGDSVRIPPLRLPQNGVMRINGLMSAPVRKFHILYEDDLLLALDKPSGVAVHGGSGVNFGVIEQLRKSRPAQKFFELVHRLDKQTSGVLLIAKKRSALRALQEQFRRHSVHKTYLTLVNGRWPTPQKLLNQPLLRYRLPPKLSESLGAGLGERRVRVADHAEKGALEAITLVHLQKQLHNMSLLRVTLKTGRTHQIRVHLAHAGHAILGDDQYGDFALNRILAKQGLQRMFLHAIFVHIKHPDDGRYMKIHAPLPQELVAFMDSQD